MHEKMIEELSKYLDGHPIIGRRTKVLFDILGDTFDETATDIEKSLHKRETAKLVNDKGFNDPIVAVSKPELNDLIDIIYRHAMDTVKNCFVYAECPINIGDTVYIVENKVIIPCKVTVIRAVKVLPQLQPHLELYVTSIQDDAKLKGCNANVLNAVDPSGEKTDKSTWVNTPMYGTYWFYTEEEAKNSI